MGHVQEPVDNASKPPNKKAENINAPTTVSAGTSPNFRTHTYAIAEASAASNADRIPKERCASFATTIAVTLEMEARDSLTNRKEGLATNTTPMKQTNAHDTSNRSMCSFKNTRANKNVTIGDVKISEEASPSGNSVMATYPKLIEMVPLMHLPNKAHFCVCVRSTPKYLLKWRPTVASAIEEVGVFRQQMA